MASDHGKVPNKVKRCLTSHIDTRTCTGLAGFSDDKQDGAGGYHTKQTSVPHIDMPTQSPITFKGCDSHTSHSDAVATIMGQDITTAQHDSINSKYDLPIRIKPKPVTYKDKLSTCPTLQIWDAQNKFKLGFLPLGDLKMPQQIHPICRDALPLRLHKLIKNTGRCNFEEVQITLNSQLNPDIWDSLLKDYWDQQLCLHIRFGFSLDFNRLAPL